MALRSTIVTYMGEQVDLESTHDIESLKAYASSDKVEYRVGVARNPNTPDNVKARLAVDPAPMVVYSLLYTVSEQNPLPYGAQLALVNYVTQVTDKKDKSRAAHQSALLALFHKCEIAPDLIERLLDHHSADLRAAALNASKDVDAIRRLARDKTITVRIRAAMHPLCPEDTEVALAQDKHPTVRCMVARKTKNPELITLLSHDVDSRVLVTLARNPNCDNESQMVMANRRLRDVSFTLLTNPNCSPEVALMVFEGVGENDYRLIECAVRNEALPLDMRAFTASRSRSFRVKKQFFESLSQEQILTLIQSDDNKVREYASRYMVRTVLL